MSRRGFSLIAAILISIPGPSIARPGDAPARASVDRALQVGVVKGSVYNPWTRSNDEVELRSFRGEGIVDGSFVAPTIRVQPGQTLRVRLENRLPPCTTEQLRAHRCYNDTNLHTHGLWVSPAGNSDNVLISIPPGRDFQYEYNIPADHPAGTFWYHPHRHGNTAVQVSSGMAGALIVTGDRPPTEMRPGDIDILLRDSGGRAFPERVLLFQQMQYACFDEKGAIRSRRENNKPVRPWVCPPGEVGRIELFPQQFLQSVNWGGSGRFTSINGQVQPQIAGAKAGQFERWRLIHGGARELVRMRLYRLADDATDLRSVPGEQQADWIARNCRGPALPMWHLAMDGLTRSEVRQSDESVLFPGDRVDVVTYFRKAGRYCVVHEPRRKDNPPRVLGLVGVMPAQRDATDPATLLKTMMMQSARRSMPGRQQAKIRRRVIDDLRDGFGLASFVWHRPISQAELTGRQEVVMNILGEEQDVFLLNDRSYDHRRIDRFLPLGGVEEWHIRSAGGGGHPLHIHVNPFQVVSITNDQGADVTSSSGVAYDPDYAGVIGQWRDGIFVKKGHRAVVRTRYERFIGDFVIHCHILRHGDSGMMQNIRIYLPGSTDDPMVKH